MSSTFTLKDAAAIRDDILRTQRAGLVAIGVANPNLTPGSDAYVLAQAIGDQFEIAMANAQTKADAMMPDTATGTDLDRILTSYGLARRAASGAAGNVTLSSTTSTTVTVGASLVDGAGQRYLVTIGGTYANGATIPVQGLDTGSATNHAAGTVLRWVTPPPFAAQTVVVATGGLTGGVDAEDDETARQRLYSFLRTPPSSGNWQQVATICEGADTLVQKAFVYPAVNGPGNVAVAVVGYATSVSKSRVVPALNVANGIKPTLDGSYPEHVDTIVTGTVDVSFDLSIALTLPASPKASPAGPGGGWTDGTTWPRNSTASATFRCTVTAVASSTSFTVDAPTSPVANITQIAWLSPVDWTVYTATVTGVTGSAGVYVVTLDKPFPNIAVGDLISPNAVNIATYYASVLTHFAYMGPGEKASAGTAGLIRGYRHPVPAQSWPSSVDDQMLRRIVTNSSEVQSAQFLYRTSSSAPAVPGTVATGPNIYIPRKVAFYEKV